jgi:deoxyribodipyrimidine photolyase-related protein
MRAALALATQLFDDHAAVASADALIVVEADRQFRRLPYHRHKIVLLLAGMRHLVERARSRGVRVAHVRLEQGLTFAEGLDRAVAELGATELVWMSATDRGVDERLQRFCSARGLGYEVLRNDLFLTDEEDLDAWFEGRAAPLMEDFYHRQRERTGILMSGDKPVGGRWNYDHDNRKPLPKGGVEAPPLPLPSRDPVVDEVIALVDERFPEHPGRASGFWLPVTPEDARSWLDVFVRERLELFGRYEDAMAEDEPFLFHSVLSPMLNVGLVTVHEVLDAVQDAARGGIPLASLEGFVRQVIGWREYMRGMYRGHPELDHVNAFGFERQLEPYWYTGEDVPDDLPYPVRRVLERVHERGYAHHIERLMVLGNWFLQEEYAPAAVTRWYSALFVDAYPWVMVPNVMGMSQYADGGLVATKPYLSGGAYLQRMGRWWANAEEARASAFTDGYWRFLRRHDHLLADNPRMKLALAQARERGGG